MNGSHVGNFGRLPPDSFVPGLPLDTVFDLSSGLTHPGEVAHIALRIWYPPFSRQPGGREANATLDTVLISGGPTAIETGKRQPSGFDAESLASDQARTLHAEDAAARAQARLRNALPATLNVLILLIGLAILLLARSSRSSDLYLYGAMLTTLPWITLFLNAWMPARSRFQRRIAFGSRSSASCPHWSSPSNSSGGSIASATSGSRLTYVCMAFFNIGVLLAFSPAEPSAWVAFSLVGYRISLQAFNVLTLFAWLNRAVQERSYLLSYLSVDERLTNLHSDPRFDELVHRVGLPAPR